MSEKAEKKMKQKELKRRNITASVDRIEEFLQNYQPARDAGEVPLRLERLEHYMERFETIQGEYEAFEDSDEFAKVNFTVRAKFEEQYFRVKAGLMSKLPPPTTAIVRDQQASTHQQGLSSPLAGIKLPTIKLPEFDGNYNDWLSFHDTFLALIHTSIELTSVQKFHYLRASLSGEAARLIETLTITTNNYAVAWEILLNRYSNKYLLRKKHIQALLEYPRIKKESAASIHSIVDDFQRHTKVLEQLGEPTKEWIFKENSTTTKTRVVFDGSAKTSSGLSINDALLVGPVIQDDLLSIILRFRKHPVALVADIEKMYRQVLISTEDQCLQRILWRFTPCQPITTYELTTVTYGLSPSSFLATRSLHQLCEDEGKEYPLASKVIRKDFYVDDLISGEKSIEQAIQLRIELEELLKKGGFRLRKWCSNYPAVLAGMPSEMLGTESTLFFDTEETVRTLGICWEPAQDSFRFDINSNISNQTATKRNILSKIAQLYDPLGLMAPVVIEAKILMQQLWTLSLDWDAPVPIEIEHKWERFCRQLPKLSMLCIRRCAFGTSLMTSELHTFADASEAAYGACVYVRSISEDGSVDVNLLAAKSRVAPLKRITLPRLELCAALLGARLYEKVQSALNIPIKSSYFWSDSTVVLQWLKSPPHAWKTFVANRTSEIQSITHGSKWLHVAGAENPADLASRGLSAEALVENMLWFHGAKWLAGDMLEWPFQIANDVAVDEELERRPIVLSIQTAPIINPLFTRFSSYNKLVSVVAYCLRFIYNAQRKNGRIYDSVLSVNELNAARKALVKMVQANMFAYDLQLLKNGVSVSKQSSLKLLNPFLDADGVIRVGGRLRLSKERYSVKHPMVLPGFHPFTKCLIAFYHQTVLHGGISLTLAVIRDKFWPLQGQRAVRSVLRKCFRCARLNPRPIQQPVGQLPSARVTPSRPFSHVGIDYCGPVYIKSLQRKCTLIKAYIAIFVCFSTKAVHIELVGDLSTAAFISAVRRFISRRGKPEHIYSDNAKNFVGAANELHRLYKMLQPGPDADQIASTLAKNEIQWHLIPPKAPNFGGLWEAAVKVAKKHLLRQVGTASLTYEDMITVLTQIEACMNSRPLAPLTEDPTDLSALTPAHFLVGTSLQALPDVDVRAIPTNRLDRYQRIQEKVQHFWHRWRTEYLRQLLQQTLANPEPTPSAVLMQDESSPPLLWPIARVLEIQPGKDNVTRVVTLRTSSGIFKRAVSKICPLPLAGEVEFETTSN
ncbi:uncharacterized protein LOC131680258 [Topomyia yanbarensis]|uniref:uncharacterized protein LOC131680258 n=1 Tax=Topomyia yanbarensis TaxID=2498891 RepID=UPI00273BD47B|nr:uncharacterized protein LOC131680258 [Topomyia yanbarensis]